MSGSIEIGINGMSCGSCVGRVERALASEPGVIRAQVNLATAKAHVDFSGQADPDSVIRAISACHSLGGDPGVGYVLWVVRVTCREGDQSVARCGAVQCQPRYAKNLG
jgi:copper chaperone CopZ